VRKRWLLLAILLAAGAFSLAVGCTGGFDWLLFRTHATVERLLGQTPQRKVNAYLDALRQGDRDAALARWPGNERLGSEYEVRRQRVTDELLCLGPSLRHRVVDIEWWRNCCEPGPIDDPDGAGVARMRIEISNQQGQARLYIFDVTTTRAYWGAAGGNPIRRWVLRDVYRQDEPPLGFPVRADGDRLIWTNAQSGR